MAKRKCSQVLPDAALPPRPVSTSQLLTPQEMAGYYDARAAAILEMADMGLESVREALRATDPEGNPDHRARLLAVDRLQTTLDKAMAVRSAAGGGDGLVYIEELERRRAMWVKREEVER